MMMRSAAWSISVTKSFVCFCEMRTLSTSRAARLMMAPAARAALTATLSMGCWLDDILFKSFVRGDGTHAGDAECHVSHDFTGRVSSVFQRGCPAPRLR